MTALKETLSCYSLPYSNQSNSDFFTAIADR